MRFSTYLQEASKGTKGHEYQKVIAQSIQDELKKLGKESNYGITVAGASSTLPDILIESGSERLIIECKMGNAQSGAITWKYDGSNWAIHATAKSSAACQQNSELCKQIMQMLSSLNVLNRITDIFYDLARWCPPLKLNPNTPVIPFKFCKEFYPVLLDKYSTKDYGSEGSPGGDSATCGGDDALCAAANRKGKWQLPVPSSYWQVLNSMMKGDNYLQIQGGGLLAVNGASFPSWFTPIASIPKIDSIAAAPSGNIELRLKASGTDFHGVRQNRNLIISKGSKEPSEGDFIHAYGLQATDFQHADVPMMRGSVQEARSNVHKNRKPLKYVLGSASPPSGAIAIGKITKLYAVSQTKAGDSLVECEMEHRTGTCGFETNLRIDKVANVSSFTLDKRSDCTAFVAAFK